MKKQITLSILSLVIFLASCSKTNLPVNQTSDTSLYSTSTPVPPQDTLPTATVSLIPYTTPGSATAEVVITIGSPVSKDILFTICYQVIGGTGQAYSIGSYTLPAGNTSVTGDPLLNFDGDNLSIYKVYVDTEVWTN